MQTSECKDQTTSVGKEKRSGAYPFPLTDGASESPYLTWVRHRSNYMAIRGPLDYIRSLGVLVRGILINLLVITPWLLLIACAISLSYSKMAEYPFFVTRLVVGLWLLSVLFWPVLCALANIVVYKRTLDYGSGSSVKERDFYERTFGLWLLLILCVFGLESFPFILSTFHELLSNDTLPVEVPVLAQNTLSPSDANMNLIQAVHNAPSGGLSPWLGGFSLGSVIALAAASNKLLSAMGGFKKKLLIGVLALLGLLVPSIAVLFVVDYLIYGDAPKQIILIGMNIVMFIGSVLVLAALIIGRIRGTFGWKETWGGGFILATLLSMNFGAYVLKMHASESAGTEKFQIQDNSIASANRLLTFWGDSDPQFQIAIDWQNYFNTPQEQETAHVEFWRLVQEPMVDLVKAGELSGTVYDQAQIVHEVLARVVEPEPVLQANSKFFKPLAEIYAVVFGGYNYHANKNKTQRTPLDFSDPGTLTLLTNQMSEALVSNAEGQVIYPAVKIYEAAFVSGLERFRLNNAKLMDDMADVLGKSNDRLPEQSADPNLFDSLDPHKITRRLEKQSREHYFDVRVLFIFAVALILWAYCWFLVDVNSTSIHALYRDRLASTFLIGIDKNGSVDIEYDIDLEDINAYAAGSTAPYHLVNAALNLQGSRDVSVRNRKCGFFIFSKRFTGSKRTGYCRSEVMEHVFPQMSLATAMAISAAAASPNMGRSTSGPLVAFMTMLNIRLGIWIPHPGRVEEGLYKLQWKRLFSKLGAKTETDSKAQSSEYGFNFNEVFAEEIKEIEQRWEQAYDDPCQRDFLVSSDRPSVNRHFVGLALSGGGIRSATINLGITQALEKSGVFRHIDFMSTVSGGGYLGASISTLMRSNTRRNTGISGNVSVERKTDGRQSVSVRCPDTEQKRQYEYSKAAVLSTRQGDRIEAGQRILVRPGTTCCAENAGVVHIERDVETGVQVVTIKSPDGRCSQVSVTRFDELNVCDGQTVECGGSLTVQHNTFADRFRWRVRPAALVQEVFSWLNSDSRCVNLSDGGHIENLAVFELLRRRCRFIIVGDGEEDAMMRFGGLATLIRTARIDLGVEILIDLSDLQLNPDTGFSNKHWSLARIRYPNEKEEGLMLYLKSSYTGDEDPSIAEYRYRNPAFPHESTADQFFVEDQFEAYRSLGQHIAEDALASIPILQERRSTVHADTGSVARNISFEEVQVWFSAMSDECDERSQSRNNSAMGDEAGPDDSDDRHVAEASEQNAADLLDSASNVVGELTEME